jgi:hypothetical protein
MSKYTMYYNARQDMYRTFATNWSDFAKQADLTDTQRRGMNLFFKPIARRFGLINEFKEIGVI